MVVPTQLTEIRLHLTNHFFLFSIADFDFTSFPEARKAGLGSYLQVKHTLPWSINNP